VLTRVHLSVSVGALLANDGYLVLSCSRQCQTSSRLQLIRQLVGDASAVSEVVSLLRHTAGLALQQLQSKGSGLPDVSQVRYSYRVVGW
jgi:hypothetical protein